MDDLSREQYDKDQLVILQQGGEANKILKKTFEFHTKIGHALMEISKKAASKSGQLHNWPNPKGPLYNDEFSKMLASGGGHEAAEWVKEYASSKDDKRKESYRTRLMEVMRKLPPLGTAIEAWRATLSANDRDALNNPESVLRAYRAYERAKSGIKPKVSKKPGLKDEVIRLQTENDFLKEKEKQFSGYRVLKREEPKVMAKKILEGNPVLTTLSRADRENFVKVFRNELLSSLVKAAARDEDMKTRRL